MLLNKELDADDAEMTRTRKVRRAFVAEKYAPVIEALLRRRQGSGADDGHHLRGRPQEHADLDPVIHDIAPARGASMAAYADKALAPIASGFAPAISGPGPYRASRCLGPGSRASRAPAGMTGAIGTEAIMWDELQFAFALTVSGLSIGLMYSLIALGFVLVYKATDAINFAQGEFVMLAGFVAALALAAKGMPVHRARSLSPSAVMVAVQLRARARRAAAAARPARRRRHHGHHRPGRHAARPAADHRRRRDAGAVAADRRQPDRMSAPSRCRRSSSSAPSSRWCSSALFTWFFLKSRMGVAMRAVADNQQVAMAMGINVERYFALAWAMAGIVSALGGVIWGSMLGVDMQLALVGLKVFPVVILGGLDSILGAVVGGLIVGVVESLAAGYLDPYVGGGTKDFAPYVLMIIVLMFKPYGIFGTHRIERV